MKALTLEDFVAESNRIEGIVREPGSEQLSREVVATKNFVKVKYPTVMDLRSFVTVVTGDLDGANGARLRNKPGMDVRVGMHRPPSGGPDIETALEALLLNLDRLTSFQAHVRYECLHPFTDGNGRSGRVLWLWMHDGKSPLGFLHQFYYQALDTVQ